MIQKKLENLLFSTRLSAFLFIVFAVAMAVGTFMEDAHGTTAARIWIYNAWWFEVIMLFFVINFSGNIFRYQLYKRKKWPTLLLHLSFILILLGAFVTRYLSYEGVMPIREGETTATFLSERTYLTVFMDGDRNGEPRRRTLEKKLELDQSADNSFVIHTDFNEQPVTISYVEYLEGVEMGLVEDETGDRYLKLVEAGDGNRHDHYLKEGEVANIHNILFGFNQQTSGAINITYQEDQYFIETPFEGDFMRMADQFQGTVLKDSVQPLQLRALYHMAGIQFVIPAPVVTGVYAVVSAKEKQKGQEDALVLDVTTKGETRRMKLLGGKGFANDMQKVTLGGLDIHMNYGSKRMELPFSIKLNDFIAEKFPGTEKGYKSYKSKIEVVDGTTSKPYDIYMNHVLDHQGYRFFQASFDPDEKGTVLSVNHDFWGTWITYIGYFLLYLGLLLILFVKGSRFKDLEATLNTIKAKKKALSVVVLLVSCSWGYGQPQASHAGALQLRPTKVQLDSMIRANAVPVAHAAQFGSVVIQDEGGRMKPANTFSSELLRKLSKKDTYEGLNADQVLVSMTENPLVWYNVPIIYLKRENDSIREILGVHKKEKYVALVDLFHQDGSYKLEPYLEAASTTNTPNNFQKDFLKTHEKFYLLNQALSGAILRVFPIPEDQNNKWVSAPMLGASGFKGMDSVYTRQIIPIYKEALLKARKTGDYTAADTYVNSIKSFQKKYGSAVVPSDQKIEAEIAYNKYDVFRNLYKYYLYAGSLLLCFVVIQIFRSQKWIRVLINGIVGTVIVLFLAHTAALMTRWYISGHAPWSDAYESMIYVGWATLFFGLAFGRKSNLTIGATAFVTSMILMIAHWNWMDPAIANLQPVLDSWWLMVHVAVIVASYGPFILGAILGIIALLLMIMTTIKNKEKMALHIKEVTVINEMSLTIGLVMLTIGNFLGGQWANESWGRYWGWDPKETWALISIMVYAFVIHMRLVPGLRGRWWYNLASVLALSTIMMTYFGVNFYLTGLHSYASGDKVVTPNFIYYSIAIVAVLGAVSYWRYKVHYVKK